MEINYEKLKLKALKALIEERKIDCVGTKEEMIECLKLCDAGKYIGNVTYNKLQNGLFDIGICLKDNENLIKMGKMVDKGIAHSSNLYCDERNHYISKEKIV